MTTRRTRIFSRALLPSLVAALTVAAALRPAASEAHDPPVAGSRIVVVNKNQGRLLVVDPATQQVVGAAPTGPDPHEVAVSPGRIRLTQGVHYGNKRVAFAPHTAAKAAGRSQ